SSSPAYGFREAVAPSAPSSLALSLRSCVACCYVGEEGLIVGGLILGDFVDRSVCDGSLWLWMRSRDCPRWSSPLEYFDGYGVLIRCVPAKLVAVLHLLRLTLTFRVPMW
ncbi:hypothetical protein HID58_071876, partial [Brassica napus]